MMIFFFLIKRKCQWRVTIMMFFLIKRMCLWRVNDNDVFSKKSISLNMKM